MKTQAHKYLDMNIHSSFIHDIPKSVNSSVTYTATRLKLVDIMLNEKPGPKAHALYDFIYVKYEKRQNQSMVVENKVTLRSRGGGVDWQGT